MVGTREIIGIRHEGKRIQDAVVDYIDSEYPNLQKIMLELSPGYEITHENSFFTDIARHYQSKDVEVVIGDRRHWDVLGLSLDEVIHMMEHNPLRFIIQEEISKYKGFFNGKLFKDRDQDMNYLLNEEKPEVTLVGGLHAKYLKRKNPEISFSYFTTRDFMGNLVNRNTMKMADYVHTIDEFNPKNINEYRKDLIKCGVSASMVGLSAIFDLPASIEVPLVGFGTYFLLDNLKGSLNYVRARKG